MRSALPPRPLLARRRKAGRLPRRCVSPVKRTDRAAGAAERTRLAAMLQAILVSLHAHDAQQHGDERADDDEERPGAHVHEYGAGNASFAREKCDIRPTTSVHRRGRHRPQPAAVARQNVPSQSRECDAQKRYAHLHCGQTKSAWSYPPHFHCLAHQRNTAPPASFGRRFFSRRAARPRRTNPSL